MSFCDQLFHSAEHPPGPSVWLQDCISEASVRTCHIFLVHPSAGGLQVAYLSLSFSQWIMALPPLGKGHRPAGGSGTSDSGWEAADAQSCVQYKASPATPSPRAEYSPQPVFVNRVLGARSHTPSFTPWLGLLGAPKAQHSNRDAAWKAHRAENIAHLTPHRKHKLSPEWQLSHHKGTCRGEGARAAVVCAMPTLPAHPPALAPAATGLHRELEARRLSI